MVIGLLLIVIGIMLFIAEAFVPGFFIGVLGTAFLVFGGFALALGDAVFTTPIAPVVTLIITFISMGAAIWFYKKIGKVHAPMASVGDSLIGKEGVVIKTVLPGHATAGKVRVASQVWSATANKRIAPGRRVTVVGSEGVHLVVKEKSGRS